MTKLTKFQEEWLTALESGKYKQITNALRKEEGFCCLGVACQLHSERNKGGGWMDHGDDAYTYLGSESSLLPSIIKEELNLHSISGFPENSIRKVSLVSLNDDEKKTFPEIAAIIRANPDNYFYKEEED